MLKSAININQIYIEQDHNSLTTQYSLNLENLQRIDTLELKLYNYKSEYVNIFFFLKDIIAQQISIELTQNIAPLLDLSFMNAVFYQIHTSFTNFQFQALQCNINLNRNDIVRINSVGLDFHSQKCYKHGCQHGTYLSPKNSSANSYDQCFECDNGCKTCAIKYSFCTSCYENTFLFNEYCRECSLINQHCDQCTFYGVCTRCQNGGNPENQCLCNNYDYSSLTDLQIQQSNQRCLTQCSPTCGTCMEGIYNKCIECKEQNGNGVQENGLCGCKKGYYMSELQGFNCEVCPYNCGECQTDNSNNFKIYYSDDPGLLFCQRQNHPQDYYNYSNKNKKRNKNTSLYFIWSGVGIFLLIIIIVCMIICRRKYIQRKQLQYESNTIDKQQTNNQEQQSVQRDEEIQQFSKNENDNIDIQYEQSIPTGRQIQQITEQENQQQQIQQTQKFSYDSNSNNKEINILGENQEDINSQQIFLSLRNSKRTRNKVRFDINPSNGLLINLSDNDEEKEQEEQQNAHVEDDNLNQAEEYQTISKNKRPKKQYSINSEQQQSSLQSNGNYQVKSIDEFEQKYEKQFLIGKGMFGKVYQIKQKSNGKIYAVKQIKTIEEHENKILKKELEVYKYIQNHTHPNVTNAIDLFYGKIDKIQDNNNNEQQINIIIHKYMIVMERGQFNLLDYINIKIKNNEDFTPQETKQILLQCIEGLLYFEKHNINHRDIKPQNIIIMDDFNIKFTDFGVSKISDNQIITHQSFSFAQGTPVYMSPEMYKKMKKLQELPFDRIQEFQQQIKIQYMKSDIYSLGLTILQAINKLQIIDLMGINCDSEMILLDKQLNKIQDLQLKQILQGMLVFNADDRFDIKQIKEIALDQ